MLNSSEIAHTLVDVASGLQAEDIVMLDISSVTTIADYFVILSASTGRHIRTLRDDMVKHLKDLGVALRHSEGTLDSGWFLLDFGDVIVHVFGSAEREYYQLEQLWANAVQVVRIQ